MTLDESTKAQIEGIAMKYAKQGRPERDVPHVQAVAFYIQKLIDGEGGEEKVLLPAAYLHDIGYAGLLDEGYDHQDNLNVKEDHMERGAKMAREELQEIDAFSQAEIEEISDLIRTHDELTADKNKNEQLVFEADSLGQIDVDRVSPNFSEEEFNQWLETEFKQERVPLFQTQTGKMYLKKLLPKAENHFS